MTTGGKLVVQALRNAHVEIVFGLHGAHIDSVFQGALDEGLRIIDTRSEAGAGHAAEGYARAGQRLGVALVTAGGGFTNALTPMANAFMDRTPVLFLTGSGRLDESETNTLQAGIDQVAMATPVTKWAYRVTRVDQIPRMIAQAVRIAQAAPRGPVLLDLPWDVLLEDVPEATAPKSAEFITAGLGVGEASVVCDLLARAERPVVIAGSEVLRGDGGEALRGFVQNTGIPVVSDFEGLGLLEEIEDGSLGLVQGLISFRQNGCAPDAVLMLARFGLNTGHGLGSLVPKDATVIQIDPDGRELGRLQDVTMAIAADPATALSDLAAAAARLSWPDFGKWRRQAQAVISNRLDRVRKQAEEPTERLHPSAACRLVVERLPKGSVVVADGALTYLWLSEWIATARPRAFICHGYFGSMGIGMGLALGAQAAAIAQGDRTVLITGDGALGYGLAEFDAMARAGLPVITVVLNNSSWGATQHFQEMVMGLNRVTGTSLVWRDYQDSARALGAAGYVCHTLEELGVALDSAFAQNRPACINVNVDLNPIPPEERVLMGQDPF